MLNKLNNKIKIICANLLHETKKKKMRIKLLSEDFTIISSNCIGGILLHDLGLKFNTPTINLFFSAEDFVKFCERIDYYLSIDLQLIENDDFSYPKCNLDDIKLHFVHYKSFDECVEAWNKRKNRVNLDKIYLIMTDRDGCNEDVIERFENLPYKKVLFSHKPMPKYKNVVYIPGFEKEKQVGELHKYANFKGTRYYERYFDFIEWLNK